MARINVVQGDITQQPVDAIVNAANRAMRGGGGVDGTIHRAAGPGLLQECVARFPSGLATGDAGWTPGNQLAANWVIHTVGPNFRDGERDVALLASCYRRSIEVAKQLGARSIAFPVISAGAYGWPLGEAVETAIDTVISATEVAPDVGEVTFVAYDRSMETRLQAILWSRRAPAISPDSVAALFDRPPADQRWPQSDLGPFRGDGYLDLVLRGRLAETRLPADTASTRLMLTAAVEDVTGCSLERIEGNGVVQIAELNPGHGMSAGWVSLLWWREVMIPALLAQR